jgi:carboxylesterase type B
VFGFLGGEELGARATDGTFGNYGIQDQRLAMVWVHEYIAPFGGDRDDITIFGESAGGHSVITHLTLKESFPLFRKAIIESGTYVGSIPGETANKSYAAVLQKSGCAAEGLPCILKLSASTLINLQRVDAESKWGPVVDGVLLSDSPLNLIRKGQYNNRVPVLLGSNRDEAAFFLLLGPGRKLLPLNASEQFLDMFLAWKFPSQVADVKKLYDPSRYEYPSDLGKFSQTWWTVMRIWTDAVPGLGPCGTRSVARDLVAGGSPGVFVYVFEHPAQEKSVPGTGPGSVLVPHASEISFVFGAEAFAANTDERVLALSMSSYWSAFAVNGHPPQKVWPMYHDDAVISFTTSQEGGITVKSGFRKAVCDYWDAHQKSQHPAEEKRTILFM